MKQLKFMLAAATAFGLASAQAATEDLDNENFTYPDTQVVTEIDGFSFEGAAGDNESAIVNNALKVNTGTVPLLRQLNTKYGEAIDLTAEGLNSLNIDTKVKFTVTPEGDDVTATAGDKLMIYLKEVPEVKDGDEVVSAATTKLMVKAAKYSEADGAWVEGGDDYEVTLPEAIESVTADTWYRLIVKTKAYAYGFDDEGVANSWWPVFQIYLASATDDVIDDADLCKMGDVDGSGYGAAGIDTGDDEADSVFVSLAVSAADGEGAGSSALSLTKVGFAGEGMVDDFVVTKDYVQTSVDFTFTLAWDAVGFSSVTYTIDGGDSVTPVNGASFTVPDGKQLVIDYTLNDWYKISGSPVLEYTAAVNGTGSLTLEAVPTANVDSEGNVEVTTGTQPTDVYVSGGSFASTATEEAVAELNKALTWAKKVAGKTTASAAGELVSNLNFADETETPAEQAYLLNCDPNDDEELKAAKDNFKFDAFDPLNPPTADDFAKKGYNGTVTVQGAATLGAWGAPDANSKFFRAVLTK